MPSNFFGSWIDLTFFWVRFRGTILFKPLLKVRAMSVLQRPASGPSYRGLPPTPELASLSNENRLSRQITAASVNSSSSMNNSFETHWLPQSTITTQKSFKVTLRLSKHEIDMLKKSWEIVTASSAEDGKKFNSNAFTQYLFCIQFYKNLMAMDPEIERLVPNIKHQANAFAGVLSTAINTLDDLSKMNDLLSNLGRLHARILGIDSPYFKTMGNALIKTFQDWFGNSPEKFPIELEEAWIKLYCYLANSILQGGIDPIIDYSTTSMELTEEEVSESTSSFFTRQSLVESTTLKSTISSRFGHTHQRGKSVSSLNATTINKTVNSVTNNNNTQFNKPHIKADSTSNFNKFKKSTKNQMNKDGECTIM